MSFFNACKAQTFTEDILKIFLHIYEKGYIIVMFA